MNRRSFIKTITSFVAGVVAAFTPKAKVMWATPVEGTPRRKGSTYPPEPSGYPGSHSASVSTSNWDNLGCKNCFVGCGQFDDCRATLRKQLELLDIERKVNPAFVFKPGEWTAKQEYPLGTKFGKYTYVKKV